MSFSLNRVWKCIGRCGIAALLSVATTGCFISGLPQLARQDLAHPDTLAGYHVVVDLRDITKPAGTLHVDLLSDGTYRDPAARFRLLALSPRTYLAIADGDKYVPNGVGYWYVMLEADKSWVLSKIEPLPGHVEDIRRVARQHGFNVEFGSGTEKLTGPLTAKGLRELFTDPAFFDLLAIQPSNRYQPSSKENLESLREAVEADLDFQR